MYAQWDFLVIITPEFAKVVLQTVSFVTKKANAQAVISSKTSGLSPTSLSDVHLY
jgi:3-hydroxyacyl-CoA dehydrogenase